MERPQSAGAMGARARRRQLDYPKSVRIGEEGPREGFQIESAAIPTTSKIRFIEALADAGLQDIQTVSFVNPARVPSMADAEIIARALRPRPGVHFTATWMNLKGLERALATPLHVEPRLMLSASERFERNNTGKDFAQAVEEQRRTLAYCREKGLTVKAAIITTAFGCNLQGAISPRQVCDVAAELMRLMDEAGNKLEYLRIADTVGWATPVAIARVVGALRERWPDLRLGLHLHDTRGTGLANAAMGLSMGIADFDSSCAGLGGCPFAGHAGAAGNICTEDFVFMCHEMGIETGVDLEALIECAHMAEDIVGHPLPGKLLRSGSLARHRA